MFFIHDEKVFSLSKTAGIVPFDDIKKLFEELFCYLVIAGLFDEGSPDIKNISFMSPRDNFSADGFDLGINGYNYYLGNHIARGLKDRIGALYNHPDLNDQEIITLRRIDSLFNDRDKPFVYLKGSEFTNIGIRRDFDNDMQIVAHYAARMFGQSDFPQSKKVPKIYISIFGNIHLSEDFFITLNDPKLIYGTRYDGGEKVTALWALISSAIDSIVEDGSPGYYLGDWLASLSFFISGYRFDWNKDISVPRWASALSLSGSTESKGYVTTPIITTAYNEFMYGTIFDNIGSINILRFCFLRYIVDLMMEQIDVNDRQHLFPEHSCFRRLLFNETIKINKTKTPSILTYALEALDGEDESNKDKEPEDTPPDDAPDKDASDTSTPANEEDDVTSPSDADPDQPAPAKEVNTIGLISFDKTAEGIDEDLYRQAVVALNDRIQKHDDIVISTETKAALKYWVNGLLYRTAISCTKEQIEILGLQQYLKNV